MIFFLHINISCYPSGSNQSDYDLLLKFSGELLSATDLRLLKFALSVHYYAPRIEMYNQVRLVDNTNLSLMKRFLQLFHKSP